MKRKYYPDHPKPITRRDFLSQGIFSFSALTFLPTPLGLIRNAWADTQCDGGGGKYIPFLVFDCAGGAMLPSNFLVTDQGGELLPSYSQLGWEPKNTPDSLNKDFGLPMAKKESKILEGILASASAEARLRLRMGSFCHSAQSDNNENPLNGAALVAKFGYKGKTISQAIGTQNSASGGNSALAMPPDSFKALYVPTIDVLKDSVALSKDSALGALSPNALGNLFSSGNRLSKSQLLGLGSFVSGKLLSQLTECSYLENEKKSKEGASGVDPRDDAQFQQVYNINQNSLAGAIEVVSAGIVKNVLSGISGPGVITIGGCDYHQSDQSKSDAKDREIGVQVGRAVEAAHRTKQPLFFQIITDGGCSNREGTRIWVSDANEKCMTIIGYYRPEGAVAQRRIQVGYFTKGQGAAKDALTGLGNSPLKVTASVFANYLSLHVPQNQLSSEFFKIVPSNLFTGSDELDQVLIFGA